MSKTLDIIMSLKDNVSPNLGKMNSNLQTTSGKLNAMGKSITKFGGLLKTAFIGGAITKLAYDSLKAYDVQVQAEKSVQRALENTGKTALQAQQELKDYKAFASKQQDITAFGDEATLKVISGLVSQGFGKKSIEDIVAMSQDIARSTGEEQDNVTKALSAYVKTGKGATKLAKAYKLNADLLGKGKTESERLAEVWKAFSESSHKGASTEYLKTFEGRLTSIHGRLDDMKEPVGELFNQLLGGNSEGLSGSAGALASLDELIVKATGDIQGIADKSKEFGGGITGIGAACAYTHPIASTLFLGVLSAKAVEGLATIITSVKTLSVAVEALGGSISITAGLASGLVAVLAGLIALGENWNSMAPEVKASLNETQQEANGVFSSANGEIYKGGKSIFDHNATGTNYFQGGLTSVNENGGEIMNLPNGTQIIPHDISSKMTGGYTINCPVTVQGNVISNNDFIDQIGDAISGRVQLALSNM